MEYKDTLIEDKAIQEILIKCDYQDSKVSCPMPTTPLRYEKAVAEVQAEISFEAGVEEGWERAEAWYHIDKG